LEQFGNFAAHEIKSKVTGESSMLKLEKQRGIWMFSNLSLISILSNPPKQPSTKLISTKSSKNQASLPSNPLAR